MKKSKKEKFEELSFIKKSSRKTWKLIGTVSIILLVLILTACIISIYNFFYNINEYVGYGILGIILLLIIICIIRPLVIALSNPCFTLDIVNDSNVKKLRRKNYKNLKKVANNLIRNNDNIPAEKKDLIKNSIGDYRELTSVLKDLYNDDIKRDINSLIYEKSGEVFITTAISQNPKLDMAIVIFTNIRMILQIVVRCGYYPSYAQLSKLILRVLGNALMSYVSQGAINQNLLSGGLTSLANGAAKAIPILSTIATSTIDGAANALLTLRVGFLTKKYIYQEYNVHEYIQNKDNVNNELLQEVIVEANDSIDEIISQAKLKSSKLK